MLTLTPELMLREMLSISVRASRQIMLPVL
jgi:hypothetical protein